MIFRVVSVSCLLAASSCATSKGAEVDDEKLSQLPREDRQAMIDQERSVEVAKANADAARVAAKQAQEFKIQVEDELVTATFQRDEAENAKPKGNKQAQNELTARREVAARQLAAAEAKNEYADKLIEFREADVEEREADVDLAEARVEQAKYESLHQRGMAKGLDRQAILDSERHAEQKRDEAHQKAVRAQGYAGLSKDNWEKLQARSQSTAKATSPADDSPVQPPAPAKYLSAKPVKAQPAE